MCLVDCELNDIKLSSCKINNFKSYEPAKTELQNGIADMTNDRPQDMERDLQELPKAVSRKLLFGKILTTAGFPVPYNPPDQF